MASILKLRLYNKSTEFHFQVTQKNIILLKNGWPFLYSVFVKIMLVESILSVCFLAFTVKEDVVFCFCINKKSCT